MKMASRVVAVLTLAFPISSRVAAEPEGFAASLDLVAEVNRGVAGGKAVRDTAYHELSLFQAELSAPVTDVTEVRWKAHASLLSIHGRGPSEKFLGDFLAASNSEAFASLRLYAWWGEMERGDFSLRAGALLADEEFAGTGPGGFLINSSFGWPAYLSANTVNTGPAFYVPALGVRARYAFAPHVSAQLGVYDGDTFDSPDGDPRATRHGLRFQLNSRQGAFVLGEIALTPPQRPWSAKLGGWMHTAKFPDLLRDRQGEVWAATGEDPLEHGSNFGGYAIIEHAAPLAQHESAERRAHVRIGAAPENRNLLGLVADVGVSWSGLLLSRPRDVIALGFTHARFSSRHAASARVLDPLAAVPEREQVAEVTYHFAVRENMVIQPDLQFIRRPGGLASRRDAVLLSLRFSASY